MRGRSRSVWNLLGLVVLGLVCSSCGSVVRQGGSAVYLVINQLTATTGGPTPGTAGNTLASSVITNVTSPAPCAPASPCPTVFNDSGQVQLSLAPKDVTTSGTPTGPTSNSAITIGHYQVSYARTDGHNTPGTDVPYPFTGAITGTVPLTGTLTLSFVLVRIDAKEEPPLVQLITSPTVLTTIATVTFYGQDQVGNNVSVSGALQVDFGNFGGQ